MLPAAPLALGATAHYPRGDKRLRAKKHSAVSPCPDVFCLFVVSGVLLGAVMPSPTMPSCSARAIRSSDGKIDTRWDKDDRLGGRQLWLSKGYWHIHHLNQCQLVSRKAVVEYRTFLGG